MPLREIQAVLNARDGLRARIASLFSRRGTAPARPLPARTARIAQHVLETTHMPASGLSRSEAPDPNTLPWKWLTKSSSPS